MQKEINRLEAMVFVEHNRGNEYLSMLHESQSTVSELMEMLHPKMRAGKESEKQLPVGGFESPAAKSARLSRESFVRMQKNKTTVSKVTA